MELYEAIRHRRSCRKFLPEQIPESVVWKILNAACWAPSPLNAQPWQFLVITSQKVKKEIYTKTENVRERLLEASGWKWMAKYTVDFLKEAPVLIVVVGDPKKTGAGKFLEGGSFRYEHACAAATQNMLLMAHSLGYGSLWFTLFDTNEIKMILDIDREKVPIAIVCVGKGDGHDTKVGRKDAADKTEFIR